MINQVKKENLEFEFYFFILYRMLIAFIFVLEYQDKNFQNCMEIHLGKFALNVGKSKGFFSFFYFSIKFCKE